MNRENSRVINWLWQKTRSHFQPHDSDSVPCLDFQLISFPTTMYQHGQIVNTNFNNIKPAVTHSWELLVYQPLLNIPHILYIATFVWVIKKGGTLCYAMASFNAWHPKGKIITSFIQNVCIGGTAVSIAAFQNVWIKQQYRKKRIIWQINEGNIQ